MKSILMASVSALFLSAMPALADQCKVPVSEKDMRTRVAQAAKMTPARLRELAPNSHLFVEWGADHSAVTLTNLAGLAHRVDLTTGSVDKAQPKEEEMSPPPPGLNISPTGDRAIAFDGYDLVLVNLQDNTRQKLTTDGREELAYGYNHYTLSGWLSTRLSGYEAPPTGIWSPDGRYFAALRVDRRGLRDWPVMIASEPENGHRIPTVEYIKMALPGDEAISQGELLIFDVQTGKMAEAQMPPVPLSVAPLSTGGLRWGPNNEKFYIGVEARDFKTRDAWVIDAKTGEGRIIYTEKSDTALRDFDFPVAAFWPIGNTSELLVFSERDNGRGHFFVYDIKTGEVLRQLTKGDWSVFPDSFDKDDSVTAIDVKTRTLFFTAAGKEKGRDPYYLHLYKMSLDGGPIELLTPEDKNHKITLSLDHGVFVDHQSTVGGGAKTIIRKLDGTLVTQVAETDLRKLKALGWTPPQRVRLMAADGETPIWGTLTSPPTIQGKGCHPILDAIYAGPQSLIAPVEFLPISWMYAQSTAQMGFAVLQLDSRGTPLRDRKFRNATYGRNFGAKVTADDHAAAIKQLAKRFNYIDADRAGIYGASWGGYHTVRAMGHRPDVFKVGVASSGSHDNYLYAFEHDRWFGTPQEFPDTFDEAQNFKLAPRITGKLLLTHGLNDDDTHVMNSFLMAGALAEASVKFDMLILPDLTHNSIIDDPYVMLRTLDYFTHHLLDVQIPFDEDIADEWQEKAWYEY